MIGLQKLIPATILVVILSILIIIVALNIIETIPHPVFTYRVSGGVAGFMNEFVLYENGSLTYRNLKTGDGKKIVLDDATLRLFESLCENISKITSVNISAVRGADFFTYRLEVNRKVFEWVDPIFADRELPEELSDLHSLISAIIRDKIAGRSLSYGGSKEVDRIWLSVEFDRYSCRINELVNIKIIIENRGEEAFTYTSPTSCDPEVIISSDLDCVVEFIKPVFPKNMVCIEVIEKREIPAYGRIENIAVISFNKTGVAHMKIAFPYAAFEQKIEVIVPIFVLD